MPEVVGSAINGILGSGYFGADAENSRKLTPSCAQRRAAFAVSITEPPPSATTQSAPLFASSAVASSTMSIVGSPAGFAKTEIENPFSDFKRFIKSAAAGLNFSIPSSTIKRIFFAFSSFITEGSDLEIPFPNLIFTGKWLLKGAKFILINDLQT